MIVVVVIVAVSGITVGQIVDVKVLSLIDGVNRSSKRHFGRILNEYQFSREYNIIGIMAYNWYISVVWAFYRSIRDQFFSAVGIESKACYMRQLHTRIREH